jgi:hypothetical protein
MGYFSELAIELQNERGLGRTKADDGDLAAYAEALGGEVDGRFIMCPALGRPADDRSLYVRIDRDDVFFYSGAEGAWGKTEAWVRETCGLPEKVRRDYSDYIRDTLAEAVPATGTIVETYLRSRSLTLPVPPALRFHRLLKHSWTGRHCPVMVAERLDAKGRVAAIHRTFLRYDGSGKINAEPQRADLGPAKGTAIRLSPVSEELLIGEGIETTLSAMQATGRPGWAAGSAGALPLMVLPPEVRSVTILVDGDDAGEKDAAWARRRWLGEGRCVKLWRAPKGYDFNDVLMGRVR